MLWTMIIIVLVVTGVLMVIIGNKKDKDLLIIGGVFQTILAGMALIIFVSMIISAHVFDSKKIADNKMEYEALCKRVEIINSDYEDVSKSDIIKDVAKWNKKVYSEKYWGKNIWTSWFYDQDVVDELEYIDLPE